MERKNTIPILANVLLEASGDELKLLATDLEVALRSRAAGYPGRMIAISGYGQESDVCQALKSGFDAHLVKPIDAATLRRLIAEN